MTEMERMDALGNGNKAQEQKWKVHSMLRGSGTASVAGVSGALVTGGGVGAGRDVRGMD